MLKSVMAHPNRSPSSWNYWGFYLIELLQLTVGLGTIIFLTKIQSFIYNLSAICQRMNDKKIVNCMQFAIKRNIMKKKEEAISMARTANVFARVEPEVKEQAEYIQQVKLKQK